MHHLHALCALGKALMLAFLVSGMTPTWQVWCLQDIDVDNRKRLYEAVMLSGGSTMFPGLPTRLERDVRQLYLDRVLKVFSALLAAMLSLDLVTLPRACTRPCLLPLIPGLLRHSNLCWQLHGPGWTASYYFSSLAARNMTGRLLSVVVSTGAACRAGRRGRAEAPAAARAGPATAQAPGVPGRRRAGGHHARARRILGERGRVG